MHIKDSIVLVTGSNRGLGRTLVEQLLARGARKVYAASRGSGFAFNDPRVVPLSLDITSQSSVDAAAKVAHDVQLLINNAGVFSAGPVLGSTNEQLRGDMEVNYFGLINVIRGFIPVLEKSKGSIANVLSVVSLANWSTFGGYSATKAAAWSLTQSLRVELKSRGIRLHAAFPGMIDTEMVAGYPGDKASTLEVSTGVLNGIDQGIDDIAPDAASTGALATYLKNPNDLIRNFAG